VADDGEVDVVEDVFHGILGLSFGDVIRRCLRSRVRVFRGSCVA
jgi:hypothetical protein